MKEKITYIGKATEAGMIESDLTHIVYDLSIEDLEERKEKAKIFNNANEVAAYLGVGIDVVFRGRFPKKRVQGLNKRNYAIRTNPNFKK